MSDENSSIERRRKFYSKLRSNVIPHLMEFEQTRNSKAITISILMFLLNLFWIGVLIFIAFFANPNFQFVLFSILLLIILNIIVCMRFSNFKIETQIDYKLALLPQLCSCFDDLSWSNNYLQIKGMYEKMGLVPSCDLETYDDYFVGSHAGYRFEIVEANFFNAIDRDYISIFQGLFVRLDLKKKNLAHTVITPDSKMHVSPVCGLDLTQLEDIVFEDNFDVYTNDPVEARYLITPAFMDKILKIKSVFKSSAISVAFYGKYLYLAIKTNRNLFEINSAFVKADNRRLFSNFYNEFDSIIKLIELFKNELKEIK